MIQVNEYSLSDTADAYVSAIGALARRAESEGHPGVLSYRFYVNRSENSAGATIVYADADAWVAHHRMAYQWDEMGALQATISLEGLLIFGPINDEMREMAAGISYTHYDDYAAGFAR
jgi:hypothetical protein